MRSRLTVRRVLSEALLLGFASIVMLVMVVIIHWCS